MRTIKRLSAAFLVLDGRDKSPVRQADVLVDGQRFPTVRKGDGYLALPDLTGGEHTFTISAPGYRTACRTFQHVRVTEAETVVLQHDPVSIRRRGWDHFHFRFLDKERLPLADRTVRVTLAAPCGALRVVKGTKKGQEDLFLGGGYAPVLLYQDYDGGKAGTVRLTGFDHESGAYLLSEPLAAALSAGTALTPFWDLETDREGVAVLPRISLFMPWEELEFSFTAEEGGTQTQTLAPKVGCCDVTVIFA